MSNGMIITNNGRYLLANALTGKPLVFTKAYCGDGSLPSGKDPATLSGLISPKQELPIQSMTTLSGVGTCEVVVEMSNQNLKTGFFVREYGLFARDPETGQDVLYSYRNTGNESGYLEGFNGVDLIHYTVSIVTVIDQAPNVSAVLQNTNQYVTFTRLDARIADLFDGYYAPSGFWAYLDDEHKFRPASLEQTRRALWGGADIAGLDARIARLEDAINMTMLRLEGVDQYPTFSHYIAEDFKDANQVDQFTGHVTSIVAGDDSIDIDPMAGMLPGSLYTITDGVTSEQVKVKSINLEKGIQRVILSAPVQNTYLMDNVSIYRTSATVGEQSAIGSGSRLLKSWTPEFLWRGTAAAETFSVPLTLNIPGTIGYSLSGDAAVDSSGYAILA